MNQMTCLFFQYGFEHSLFRQFFSAEEPIIAMHFNFIFHSLFCYSATCGRYNHIVTWLPVSRSCN